MIKTVFAPEAYKNFLAFDIGRNTAVAQFVNGQLLYTDIMRCPKEIKDKRHATTWLREAFVECLETLNQFNGAFSGVFIEGIQVYSSSAKSMKSAFKGDLIFLAELSGVFLAEASRFTPNAHILLPREWRGNMKDEVVVRRIQRATGQTFREHESDAVGIGLSVLGKL